jgi:two-component system chemotaxis response regulator CheB
LPDNAKFAVVIAQHMPDKFTRTFAERLDRRSALRVAEATDYDVVGEGMGFVCPGRQCMELEMPPKGPLRLRVRAPDERDRYVPSADRLLTSVAYAVGKKAIGVILTGMGDDGVQGARAIVDAGGFVVAESETTAVVYGMPGAAVRAGVATLTLPLTDIGDWISRL